MFNQLREAGKIFLEFSINLFGGWEFKQNLEMMEEIEKESGRKEVKSDEVSKEKASAHSDS